MDIVIAISAVVVLIVALVGAAHFFERRRHRRIAEAFAARRIKVASIRCTAIPSMRDVVEYISPDGELRQASLLRGAADPSDDVPYQAVLRERYERGKSGPMIRTLQLGAACSRLPGHADYQSLVRELAAGADRVTIDEAASSGSGCRRFAPVLQCLEAAGIDSEDTDGIVELVVDGKRIDLAWSVEGEPPLRRLVIREVRSTSA